MASFFQNIVNAFQLLIEYVVSLVKSMFMYLSLLIETSGIMAGVIGYLPEIIQVSGMAVISIAIFKAIFGRQGSS